MLVYAVMKDAAEALDPMESVASSRLALLGAGCCSGGAAEEDGRVDDSSVTADDVARLLHDSMRVNVRGWSGGVEVQLLGRGADMRPSRLHAPPLEHDGEKGVRAFSADAASGRSEGDTPPCSPCGLPPLAGTGNERMGT